MNLINNIKPLVSAFKTAVLSMKFSNIDHFSLIFWKCWESNPGHVGLRAPLCSSFPTKSIKTFFSQRPFFLFFYKVQQIQIQKNIFISRKEKEHIFLKSSKRKRSSNWYFWILPPSCLDFLIFSGVNSTKKGYNWEQVSYRDLYYLVLSAPQRY